MMPDDKNLQKDLEKLAQNLGVFSKLKMSDAKKNEIKAHLFEQMDLKEKDRMSFSWASFVTRMKEIVGSVKMETSAKVLLKERIFAFIGATKPKSFFLRNLFVFNRKLISTFLLMFLGFSAVSYLRMDLSVVRAETFTRIESFSGEVFVERDGEQVALYEGMEVVESDKIVTGDDGFVTVSYFDEGISRLSCNSELVLNELTYNFEDPLNNYVEVDLSSGLLWTKVLSTVGEKSFIVIETPYDVSASAKQAAFNITVSDDQVEVEVYHNTVTVEKGDEVEKILSGKKALVKTEDSLDFQDGKKVAVVDIAEEEKNHEWVQENLESDKEYLLAADERLIAKRMELLDLNVDDDLSLDNSLVEELNLFLTFDDVSKKKKELDIAERKFMEAQVKLYDEKLTEDEKAQVETVITSFEDTVKDFKETVNDIAKTDEKYGKELDQYLGQKLKVHKKDLNDVLPDSPLYGVKNFVSELTVSVADESEAIEQKKDNAIGKLEEASEVLSIGEEEKATELVQEYKDQVDELISDLEEVDDEKIKEEVVIEVGEEATDLLISLEESTEIPIEEVIPEEIITPIITAPIKDPAYDAGNKYGITVEGGKPLSPLLKDVD